MYIRYLTSFLFYITIVLIIPIIIGLILKKEWYKTLGYICLSLFSLSFIMWVLWILFFNRSTNILHENTEAREGFHNWMRNVMKARECDVYGHAYPRIR